MSDVEPGPVKQNSQATSRDRRMRARIEAQNAVQWLARLAHSYANLPAGNILLHWNVATHRMGTPEIASGIVVQLSLAPLTLQFVETGEPVPHPIVVDGKSSTEVEAWVLVELLHRGFDRERFSKRLPYDPSHLMSGDETKYSDELSSERQDLQHAFEEAAKVLQKTKDALIAEAGAASDTNVSSDLVVSPEHFDLAFVVPTFGADRKGDLTKIGFTAGDDRNAEPRFFVGREAGVQGTAHPNGEVALALIASRATDDAELVARLVQQARVVRDTAAD